MGNKKPDDLLPPTPKSAKAPAVPVRDPRLVPLEAPDGCTAAVVSRPYEPDREGVYWVTPEDAEVLVARHGFQRYE